MSKEIVLQTIFVSFALLGCSEHRDDKMTVKDNMELKEDLKALGQERVFFGHHSVGNNILAGFRQIVSENPEVQLNFLKWTDSLNLSQTFLVEGSVGKNGNPKSKYDEYIRIVEKLSRANLNIALMKLCFVDITQQANVDQIFNEYVSTIELLKQKHPSITFVHITVPLTTEAGITRRIYRFLRGETVDYTADNSAREKYNEKLRKHFASDPIFDLAAIESTHPNMNRESGKGPSGTYYSLVKEYASDEGHLNDYGGRIAARELVRILAQVARDHAKK